MNNILQIRSVLKHCLSFSNDQTLCPVCQSEEETTSHLFLRCSYTRIPWRQSPWPLNIETIADNDIDNWILINLDPAANLNLHLHETQSFQLFATLAMDYIWFYMNQITHGLQSIPLDRFIAKLWISTMNIAMHGLQISLQKILDGTLLC